MISHVLRRLRATRGVVRLVTLGLALAGVLPVRAQDTHGPLGGCPRTARPTGPVQTAFLDGQLDLPRSACPRDELAIGEDASLIARPSEFYGNLRLGTRVSGSLRVTREISIFASLEALRSQTILSAVQTSYLGLGYLSLGTAAVVAADTERVLALFARVVLPTTSGLDRGSQPLSLALGVTGELAAHPNLRAHVSLSALGSVAISELAPPDPRGAIRVTAGLDWVPFEALSVLVALASGFGDRDALDFLAVSAGLRLAFDDRIGLELGGTIPFAGAEPSLFTGQLTLSGRLDGPRR